MSAKSYLTIEEVISIPTLSGVAMSDDGQKVAYVLRTTDWDGNTYQNHVWVYVRGVAQANRHYAITTGEQESLLPQWSPDSQTLAYLSPTGEKNDRKQQIFIRFIDQSHAFQVTESEQAVEKFQWAPDGKGLYYIAKPPVTEQLKKRREEYGDFEHVDRDEPCSQIYYIPIQAHLDMATRPHTYPKNLRPKEKAIYLTSETDQHVSEFALSPDGKRLAYLAAPSPGIEDTQKKELYLLELHHDHDPNLPTKAIHLKANKLLAGGLAFSPDGNQLAYTRLGNEQRWYNNTVLEIIDLNTGEITCPSFNLDESVSLIRWTEKGILVEWQDRTNYRTGLLSPEGKLSHLVTGDDSFAHGSSITKDGESLAYLKASSNESAELYLNNNKITNQAQFYQNKSVSRKQVIQWKSEDGLDIEGILSTPPDFNPTSTHPLLVCIHGGPAAASFPIRSANKYYPIESFVEKGFIVLEPNYRGSTGYGEAFRKANYRNLGLGDYADVISGVDELISKGFVDPDKVGVMGWSQGGYISAFISTYSNRFKAISVGAGISNWITYYVNTDIHPFTRMYLGDNPWNDEDIYRKTSPMTYIKSACTPTLIQHGDHDARVPVPNAYELYQGLRDMGVETELIIFKGMGHGSNKPRWNQAIMKQNLVWFCHYLLGESMDDLRNLSKK